MDSLHTSAPRLMRLPATCVAAVLAVLTLVLSVSCGQAHVSASPVALPGTTTQYTAVFLTNGQAFFGRLGELDSPYPVLTDVYYVQTQMNQDTKEVKNTLIKRGNEWHGPDRMVLNAQHILFMEPVKPDSPVAKLIEELKKQQH